MHRAARPVVLLAGGTLLGCPADPAPPAAASAPASASAEAAAPAPACPPEMAAVDGFCIDRWEAHLALPDGTPHPSHERPPAGVPVVARSAAGVVPQGYVSRTEAAAACERAGKRLCRAREWYRACAGAARSAFPYGPDEEKGRCNTGKPHLMQQLFGQVRYTYDAHYNSARLAREPGYLARTGEHARCASPEGVVDLVGNLHEWVADPVSARLAREIPIEAGAHMLGAEGSGVFMGGYFSSNGEHGRGCAYATATHAPDYHDYSTGFRCCRDLGG